MKKITAKTMAVRFWKGLDHVFFENKNPKSVMTVEDFELYNSDKASLITTAIELHMNYNSVIDVSYPKNIFKESIRMANIAKKGAISIIESRKGIDFIKKIKRNKKPVDAKNRSMNAVKSIAVDNFLLAMPLMESKKTPVIKETFSVELLTETYKVIKNNLLHIVSKYERFRK